MGCLRLPHFTAQSPDLRVTHRVESLTLVKSAEKGRSDSLYVYASNESPTVSDVYFDDLKITHHRAPSWKYVLKDHLGSNRVTVNNAGNVEAYTDYLTLGGTMRSSANQLTHYRYTGQEYDETTGLHNYRARLYDDKVGRFYGIDPQGQFASPYGGLGLNPVNFVDPDGEIVFAIVPALLIGAALGSAGYTASVAFSKGGFDNWDWGQFGKAAAIGAVSGVATAGIGQAFGAVGGGMKTLGGQIAHEFGRAIVHGASNTVINAAFGNEVNAGTFGLAAASSLVGSGLHKAGSIAQLGSSTIMGGIGAELSGGDFWRGAATGATVAGLNHLAHSKDCKSCPEKKQESSTAGKASTAAGAASTAAGAVESITDYVKSAQTKVIPVYNKSGKAIAGWKVISKQTGQVLKVIKAGASRGGYITAGVGVVADTYDLANGNISLGRYSYHMAGTAAGIAVGVSSAGLGALVGGAFMLGEMAYDSWINTVKPAMTNAIPTGGWYPLR